MSLFFAVLFDVILGGVFITLSYIFLKKGWGVFKYVGVIAIPMSFILLYRVVIYVDAYYLLKEHQPDMIVHFEAVGSSDLVNGSVEDLSAWLKSLKAHANQRAHNFNGADSLSIQFSTGKEVHLRILNMPDGTKLIEMVGHLGGGYLTYGYLKRNK